MRARSRSMAGTSISGAFARKPPEPMDTGSRY
jgi:hypothetical protein